jgi:hypothetical protein
MGQSTLGRLSLSEGEEREGGGEEEGEKTRREEWVDLIN